MKRKMTVLLSAAVMSALLITGCGSKGSQPAAAGETAQSETEKAAADETAENEAAKNAADETEKAAADETAAEVGGAEAPEKIVPEDGVYTADFDTDSGMFHVSEAKDGKGTLTVENGQMTIHISLASKNIVNLYPGFAEDAQKEGAQILEPTVDTVTYSDGITEEVYGFDVPVPSLDQEFDLALLGKKGTWYDHKVSVSNPVPMEENQAEEVQPE